MDIADEEVIDLWKLLAKHEVRYIMIGGFATNLHGFTRTTEDIDIYLEDTIQNRNHLGDALEEIGIVPKELILRVEFVAGWTAINLNSGLPLDILTKVKGLEDVSFEECFSMAVKAEIEGVIVSFLHINHLILSKKAANRPKDQIDVIELEKIRNEQ